MMKYAIDLIYVIIAVVTIVIFTKRGFVESVFKYGRTIVASIISYAVGPFVSSVIYKCFMFDGIYYWVLDKIRIILHAAEERIDVDSLIDGLPFIVKQLLDPDEIKAIYGETMANIEQSALSFSATVSAPLANMLSNMIAYVLVFLVALILLFIFGKILDLIVHLPILRTINSVLGFAVGVGATFLLLAAITYFISFITELFGDILSLQKLAENSHLFGVFDDIHFFDLH